MMTLKKRKIIWCSLSVFYFLCIFVAALLYYRTTGGAPDLVSALHHEWIVLPFFAVFMDRLPEEVMAFVGGITFYAGIGLLLASLQHRSYKSAASTGLFYAILCSMLGYTIGVLIGGHPPAFMVLNPPLFFIGGYFFGKKTFQDKSTV